jgi:hypothetical protein
LAGVAAAEHVLRGLRQGKASFFGINLFDDMILGKMIVGHATAAYRASASRDE